jgi:uncharacterized protein YndB with AHSA1/START domain
MSNETPRSTAPEYVSVERLIPADPEVIFELLTHPERHSEFDGSGTVRQSIRSGRKVGLGDSFGMSMKWGVPYATRNVVREYEENRVIAWQTLAPSPLDKVFTGRTWRYELEPTAGGTLVRETWDTSTEKPLTRAFIRTRLAGMTRRNMERTLARIEATVAG